MKVEDMSIILYNEPNYAHILIGPHLWSVGRQMHK